MKTVADLPTEIIEYVTEYLEFTDLKALRLVSRFYNELIMRDVYLALFVMLNTTNSRPAPMIQPFRNLGNCKLYCNPPSMVVDHACYKGHLMIKDQHQLERLDARGLSYCRQLVLNVPFVLSNEEYQMVADLVRNKCPKLELIDVYTRIKQTSSTDTTIMDLLAIADSSVAVNFYVEFAATGTSWPMTLPPPSFAPLFANDTLKILTLVVFPMDVGKIMSLLSSNKLPSSVERLDVSELSYPGAQLHLANFLSCTTTLHTLNLIDSLTTSTESFEWIPSCVRELTLWDKCQEQDRQDQPIVTFPYLKSLHLYTDQGAVIPKILAPNLERLDLTTSTMAFSPLQTFNWRSFMDTSGGLRQLLCTNMNYKAVTSIVKYTKNLESLNVLITSYSDGDSEVSNACYEQLNELAMETRNLDRLRFLMLELYYVKASQLSSVCEGFMASCPGLDTFLIDTCAQPTYAVEKPINGDRRFVVDGISQVPISRDSYWHSVLRRSL